MDTETANNVDSAGKKIPETETYESENVEVNQETQENEVLEEIGKETSKSEAMAETELCQSEEVIVKRETLENEILEAIKQAGLDDKFWVKKIREESKVETVEELKNVPKDQVELFLQNTEITIQSRLRPVFSNLIGVDVSSTETITSQNVDVDHGNLEVKSTQRGDKVDAKRADELEYKDTFPIRKVDSDSDAEVSKEGIAVTSQDTDAPQYFGDGSQKLGLNWTKIHDAKHELDDIQQEYSTEALVCQAVKEAGLDDKVWVPEIQENFQLKTADQFKSLTRQQVEIYLQSLNSAEKDRLHQVFEKLLVMNDSKEETEKIQTETNMSVSNVARSAENGVVCPENRKHSLEEEKELAALRLDIEKLIEMHRYPSPEYLEPILCFLSETKKTYIKILQLWQNEVLYLRWVQRTLIQGAKYMSRLRACGPVIPGIPRLAGVDPARYALGCYGDQVCYGDGILFLFVGGLMH